MTTSTSTSTSTSPSPTHSPAPSPRYQDQSALPSPRGLKTEFEKPKHKPNFPSPVPSTTLSWEDLKRNNDGGNKKTEWKRKAAFDLTKDVSVSKAEIDDLKSWENIQKFNDVKEIKQYAMRAFRNYEPGDPTKNRSYHGFFARIQRSKELDLIENKSKEEVNPRNILQNVKDGDDGPGMLQILNNFGREVKKKELQDNAKMEQARAARKRSGTKVAHLPQVIRERHVNIEKGQLVFNYDMPHPSGSKRKGFGLPEPDAKRRKDKKMIPVSQFHTCLKTIMESKKEIMLAEGIKDPKERKKHMRFLQQHFCKTEKEIGKSVHIVILQH